MALRNSIPGRETNAVELMMLAVGIIAAALMVQFEPLTRDAAVIGRFSLRAWASTDLCGVAWVALFWAARRAMPLRPRLTGGMIGVAASSFAIAAELFSGPILFDRMGAARGGDPYGAIGHRGRGVA